MSRGPFYTEEEDRHLLTLFDNSRKIDPDINYVDVAALAIAYGTCIGRNIDAIAGHISKLDKARESKMVNIAEEEEDIEPGIAVLTKDLRDVRGRYRSLLNVLTKEAYTNNPEKIPILKFDYKAIRQWLWDNEPEYMNAWREDFMTQIKKEEEQ